MLLGVLVGIRHQQEAVIAGLMVGFHANSSYSGIIGAFAGAGKIEVHKKVFVQKKHRF